MPDASTVAAPRSPGGPCARPRLLGFSLWLVAALAVLGGCGSRDGRGARWVPTETLPARAAIDAQWHLADDVFGKAVRDRRIVGAEVLVVTAEGWSARGYGWATADTQPHDRTVFELGSISKVFTGTLLADMVVRGEVSLMQQAQTLVPGRGRMPPSTRPITLMDLATHMSGMPRLPPTMKPKDKKDPYADFDVDDLWAALEKTRLEREPGVDKKYSNYGMGLLGQLLVQKAEADSYHELLHERVLRPLAMIDTTVELRPDQEVRFAWGHDKDNVRTKPWYIPALAGAGGLRSTARDMATFVQAHLRADSPIAEAAAVALTPRNVPGDGTWDQGLGWVVSRDGTMAWHNGATGGYHTWLGIDREARVGVLVLCNTSVDDVDGWGSKLLKQMKRELGRGAVASADGRARDGAWDEAGHVPDDITLELPVEVASR